MPSETKVFVVDNLTGGRNTRDARNTIQLTQSPDDLNMEWTKFGAVQRRKGFRQYIMDSFGSNPIRGLFRAIFGNGNKYLMVMVDGKLYAYKGNTYPMGERFLLKEGYADTEVVFTQFGDTVLFCNFSDEAQTWNETVVRQAGLPQIDVSDITFAESGTGGSMVHDGGSGADYAYYFTNSFRGRGESNLSGLKHAFIPGGPSATGSVVITGLQAAKDPDADSLRIYRSLQLSTAGGTGSPLVAYFVDEITTQTSYTDTKVDSDLVVPAPADALFGLFLPKYSRIAIHKNRTFYANVTGNNTIFGLSFAGTSTFGSRLYWSEAYLPEKITGFVDVSPDDGFEITGLVSFYDQLVVFKGDKTYALFGVGPSDFRLRLINASVGCVAHRSIATLDNNLLFLGNDGVYAYNGSSMSRISEAIRPDIEAMSASRQAAACAAASGGRFFLSLVKE